MTSIQVKIGAIPETPNFYPYLNAIDNLEIVAHQRGVESRLRKPAQNCRFMAP